MSDDAFPYLLGALGVVLVIALATVFWLMRSPKVRREEHERIPLFTGGLPPGVAMPPAPPPPPLGSVSGMGGPSGLAPLSNRAAATRGLEPTHVVDVPAPAAWLPPAPPPARAVGNGTYRPADESFSTATPTPAPAGTPVARSRPAGTMVEAHAVRFSIPTDGTLQFLPGRLEICTGLDTGREIRFVRLPGPDGATVTFGRTEGPLYQHIQLHDQTVSRSHATMRFTNDAWLLTNLSTTNPVTLNGRLLSEHEESLLQDGDRIEMGEVVFAYRSR
jgi:hypothetical protein